MDVADAYTHPCASVEQVTTEVVPAQVVPAALHMGSALHVQLAAPAAPLQVWWDPQATAGA